MTSATYEGYEALGPFFSIIKEGVQGRVDGDHFFDLLTDDIVWEYPYPLPGSLPEVRGRETLMKHFRGYGDVLELDRMSDLIAHPTPDGLILEYSSHGRGVQTRNPYNNRYVSVLYIRDRKIYRWRDYSNPLVVLGTLGAFESVVKSMHEGL